MAILEMYAWWYAKGWRVFAQRCRVWFSSITDFFSMDSLVRTLFKPYRQISAGSASNEPLSVRFEMFIDRTVSRLIGFVSRLVLLLVGVLIILVGGTIALALLILWPIIPFLPIVGVVVSLTGVLS